MPSGAVSLNPHVMNAQLRVLALSSVAWIAITSPAETVVSPFGTPGTERALPQEGAASAYELTGVVNSSQSTLVGIIKAGEGRSFWIPVGQSQGGIDVLSHDPKTDRVTIRADGARHVLGLKAQSLGGSLPNFAHLGTIPLDFKAVGPAGPVAAQEREARQLIGDLLEIGLSQRTAEQQRKAGGPVPASGPKSAAPR